MDFEGYLLCCEGKDSEIITKGYTGSINQMGSISAAKDHGKAGPEHIVLCKEKRLPKWSGKNKKTRKSLL
jgi:tryptophan synthase beta subunit